MADKFEGFRNEKGQLMKGHPGGPGNPFAKQVHKLQKAIYAAITPADIADVVLSLRDKALGDGKDATAAAKVLLDRCIPQNIKLDIGIADDVQHEVEAREKLRALTPRQREAVRRALAEAEVADRATARKITVEPAVEEDGQPRDKERRNGRKPGDEEHRNGNGRPKS